MCGKIWGKWSNGTRIRIRILRINADFLGGGMLCVFVLWYIIFKDRVFYVDFAWG